MLVLAARPISSSALRSRARLSSAVLVGEPVRVAEIDTLVADARHREALSRATPSTWESHQGEQDEISAPVVLRRYRAQ